MKRSPCSSGVVAGKSCCRNLSAPEAVQREEAIDLTDRWVDHAAILNCPRVMINQGALTAASLPAATATLRRMNEYARSKGVRITVETREPRVRDVEPGTGLPLSAPGRPPAWELTKQLVVSSGNMHIKVSPDWDLATVVRCVNNDLAHKGLYSVEVSPPLIRGVYETILANI